MVVTYGSTTLITVAPLLRRGDALAHSHYKVTGLYFMNEYCLPYF